MSKALFANDYMLVRQSCIAERIRRRKSGGMPTFPTSSLFKSKGNPNEKAVHGRRRETRSLEVKKAGIPRS